MSNRDLVLSSSPRRGGHSDAMCDPFVRGAAPQYFAFRPFAL